MGILQVEINVEFTAWWKVLEFAVKIKSIRLIKPIKDKPLFNIIANGKKISSHSFSEYYKL